MQGITNEKVKILEISLQSTDYYEEEYSQAAVHECFIGKIVLKIVLKRHTQSVKNAIFELLKKKIK